METGSKKKDQYISNFRKFCMIFVKYAKTMHILKVSKMPAKQSCPCVSEEFPSNDYDRVLFLAMKEQGLLAYFIPLLTIFYF